jgi:hypothetical protein
MKPLAVDLCCGLGGWTEGLLAEGWDVVGFDIERHDYGKGSYPGQLVIQDILTLDGRQFKGKVSLIVASPPCQKYSYMSMPWSKAKALIPWYCDPAYPERLIELNALVNACFRIAKEAECPIVLENVRGAQPWIGRARAFYGSYALWGDVPALMPITFKGRKHDGSGWRENGSSVSENCFTPHKVPGFRFDGSGRSFQSASVEGMKNTKPYPDRGWTQGCAITLGLESYNGTKIGGDWFSDPNSTCRRHGSKSNARKAASAMIAKIPLALSRWIAVCYKP